MCIQKESARCILIKIKFFSNFKGFHNEHGYISYFNFIFCFYKFNNTIIIHGKRKIVYLNSKLK